MDSERLTREKYQKQYSDNRFWDKLRTAAVKAGAYVVYPALVLYYVLRSGAVSAKMKLYIVGALGYLILPVDLIPDAIPFFGYTDDLAAILAAYKLIKSCVTPEIRDRARSKASKWFGLTEISRAEERMDREAPEEQ